MKVAVASVGDHVSQHFGHCEGFNIFTVEDREIRERQFTKNPGHKPGFLPKYLKGLDIDIIIAGGMGAAAIEIFDEQDIQVITGASGNVEETVVALLEGRLEAKRTQCQQHQYGGNC